MESQNLPIGLFCDQSFSPLQYQIDPGDALLLYTDGLVELRNPENQEYGTSRVHEIFSQRYPAPALKMVQEVIADADLFRDKAPQTDDITLFFLKCIG